MERLVWQHARNGEKPHDAVHADGHVVVIRAQHDGHWMPGKLPAGHHTGYIPFGGHEVAKTEYEVLVVKGGHTHENAYKWKPACNGKISDRAISGGSDVDGETLLIARGTVHGEVCIGKVKPSHKCAYFPWGGKELKVENYEVLCKKN